MARRKHPSLVTATRAAIAASTDDRRDKGAKALALACAAVIDDDPSTITRTGPLLLAVLDALALTPKARTRGRATGAPDATSAGTTPTAKDALAELRARRAARLG